MFNPTTLVWNEKEYLIPANRMMGAIASIEEHITLNELHETSQRRNTIKLASLAGAYAAALQYAGAKVSQEDVYKGIFAQGGVGSSFIIEAVQTLILMMVPPTSVTKGSEAGSDTPKGKDNRQARRAASSLSKRRTKRQ